jgi:hypothetical protein
MAHIVRARRVLKNCQPAGAEVDIDVLIDRYATGCLALAIISSYRTLRTSSTA